MKIKTYIIGAILVLTSLTTLYAQPVFQELKVVAENNTLGNPERDIEDRFGGSVAISGNYAIVGAAGEDTDGNGLTFVKNAGAAYIFERKDPYSPWEFIQKIVAPIPDRDVDDWFGTSVAISGSYAIVGANGEDHYVNGSLNENAGAAYIFERDGLGNWTEVKKIVAPITDRAAGNSFGGWVSISGDYIIVGAVWDNPRAAPHGFGAGSAYIFERCSSGFWNFTMKLQADDRAAGDLFGSVSISGNYAIVGAQREDDALNGVVIANSGSAYIFERSPTANLCAPNAWIQRQKIEATDRESEDLFGYSVAISGDYAIVGAFRDEDDIQGGSTKDYAGSAYIFERDQSKRQGKKWVEVNKIVASDRDEKVYFGAAVAIDGNYAIVGAYGHDAVIYPDHEWNSGAAYIFERNPTPLPGSPFNWKEFKKIVNSDTATVDDFGIGVAISGCSALVGAFVEDEDATLGNTIFNAGSAYFYECKEPEKPELCCDIPDVAIAFNQYRNTDKFNLNINSGGAGIQEVEVSMIDYHVEYESAYCKPKDLGIFGNIRSTTSNFGGLLLSDNNTHSLTWDAGTPTAINSSMEIFISKPELVVDFRRCRNNTFYFCLKVKITDTDCNICEKIVCGSLKLGPSRLPIGPRK